MVEINDYLGREQAFVKHFVLDHYLGQLAIKVGQFRPGTTLNFIDGFSGPWQQATEELRDTSPHVALTKLSGAKHELALLGKDFTIRGFFVESDPIAHPHLVELLRDFPDIEVEPHHGCFEDLIGRAVRFAQSGANPFAFVFIDPTGWSGYGLRAIAPLLRVSPSEVLINFMTKASYGCSMTTRRWRSSRLLISSAMSNTVRLGVDLLEWTARIESSRLTASGFGSRVISSMLARPLSFIHSKTARTTI